MGIWEDNIKTDLEEIGYEDVDWIHRTRFITEMC
jgi:hypothetical protein